MKVSRSTIWTLLALWLGAMGLSALALTAEPVGDGFTRGLNRITGFLSWQMAAAILAPILWLAVRPLPRGDRLRWMGRLPAWWALGVLLLVLVWIAIGLAA